MSYAVTKLGEVDCQSILQLYQHKRFGDLSEQLLAALEHFCKQAYLALDPATQSMVDVFVKTFLFLFTQPDYQLADAQALRFIAMNPIISAVVGMSCFKTTDAHLEILRQQPGNFVKVLTLYSARNAVSFERKAFFDLNPWLASAWYDLYASTYTSGVVRPEIAARLADHLAFHDPRYVGSPNSADIFFGSTYVGGDVDRATKQAINASFRQKVGATKINNRPKRRRLAVISGKWVPQHPDYRDCFAYVQALRDYDLTLVWLGAPQADMEASLFRNVINVRLDGDRLHLGELVENDFEVAYFPDVGLTTESVMLANMRLAPIQIAATGHPVSTWGAQIDYFITGADVENPDRPEASYSERLVLLPGYGAIVNRPSYLPKYPGAAAHQFIINCPWGSQKINPMFCRAIEQIVRRATKPIKLRLFSGFGLSALNSFVSFRRDLEELWGPDVAEIVPHRGYADYMTLTEQGQFSLDSYHFGGCNTVVDSLWLAKPMVTWEGDKWYNRIGSQLLRMAGVPELIATSEEQYIDLALRLIGDDEWRMQLVQRLRGADFEKSIFSTENARYFRDAIEYLVAEHEQLRRSGERTPIRIG